MHLTESQHHLYREVRARIQDRPWFRGVCLDDFPTDLEIERDREAAINCVIDTTAMWDA